MAVHLPLLTFTNVRGTGQVGKIQKREISLFYLVGKVQKREISLFYLVEKDDFAGNSSLRNIYFVQGHSNLICMTYYIVSIFHTCHPLACRLQVIMLIREFPSCNFDSILRRWTTL